MSRILLGVSGGIAAYKSLEFIRLATAAGPRRARDPDAEQPPLRRRGVVRRAERRAGAGQRVRPRSDARRVPRAAAARPRADRSSRAGRQRRRVPDRAGVCEHDREARSRDGGQPADELRARGRLPARGRARDEQPHVRAPGHAGEPRDAARARGDRRRAGHGTAGLEGARRASGRLAEPAELLAACERAIGGDLLEERRAGAQRCRGQRASP